MQQSFRVRPVGRKSCCLSCSKLRSYRSTENGDEQRYGLRARETLVMFYFLIKIDLVSSWEESYPKMD